MLLTRPLHAIIAMTFGTIGLLPAAAAPRAMQTATAGAILLRLRSLASQRLPQRSSWHCQRKRSRLPSTVLSGFDLGREFRFLGSKPRR